MKITVCSLYINPWYRQIVKYGKLSIETYCKKHGYDFIYETEKTSDGVYDGKRDPPWYKILLMIKLMDKDYDYIIWNDADSMIVNYDKKLESIITSDLGDKDILVARDWQSVLNTGTMFVRNCEYCKKILKEVWENSSNFDVTLHEQASLTDLYTRNKFGLHQHLVILPQFRQNDFLTYWYCFLPGQCFIVHATRCSHDRIGFIFTMDMFCTIKMDEESEEKFNDRMHWMNSNRCLEDIQHYRNGGNRRNLSVRYINELTKKQ